MKFEPSGSGSQELQQGYEPQSLAFAPKPSEHNLVLLQYHISSEVTQAVSGPAVRRLVFNQALWEEEEASNPETVGPAASCWESPTPSTNSSVPASPERVTKFIRPNPEVLARMSQGERGAGGRALRAKAYWERRFAPLKRLEEASALLRTGMRNASMIAEQSAARSTNPSDQAPASASSASVPQLSLLNKTGTDPMSVVVVCEAAGGGPRGEKDEAEYASSDASSTKSEDTEG